MPTSSRQALRACCPGERRAGPSYASQGGPNWAIPTNRLRFACTGKKLLAIIEASNFTIETPAMNVDAPCPNCGTVFTVRRELLGKRTKCTRCGTVFTIAESAAVQVQPATRPVQAVPESSPHLTTPPPELPTVPHITVAPPPRGSSVPKPPHEFSSFERSASQSQFTVLRIVARGYEILAAIVLIIAVAPLLAFVISVIRDPGNILAALLNTGFAFLATVMTALSLLFIAQAIRLGLQIEQNTRETHQACRQLADHLCSIETEP